MILTHLSMSFAIILTQLLKTMNIFKYTIHTPKLFNSEVFTDDLDRAKQLATEFGQDYDFSFVVDNATNKTIFEGVRW